MNPLSQLISSGRSPQRRDRRGGGAGQPGLWQLVGDVLTEPRYDVSVQGQMGAMDRFAGGDKLEGAALATSAIPGVGDVLGLAADARRYATDPESRNPLNFGLSALGALPFVPGMTAWHGTPHKFAPEPDAPYGRFNLDKIGTGEGTRNFVLFSPEIAKIVGQK